MHTSFDAGFPSAPAGKEARRKLLQVDAQDVNGAQPMHAAADGGHAAEAEKLSQRRAREPCAGHGYIFPAEIPRIHESSCCNYIV